MTQAHHDPHDDDDDWHGLNAELAATMEEVLDEGERAPRTVLDAVRYIGLRVATVGVGAIVASLALNALRREVFTVSWLPVAIAMAISAVLSFGLMRRHQREEAAILEVFNRR